jgi:hypothetical protein
MGSTGDKRHPYNNNNNNNNNNLLVHTEVTFLQHTCPVIFIARTTVI